jgi:hypothetical protein
MNRSQKELAEEYLYKTSRYRWLCRILYANHMHLLATRNP